jgi:predicted flap endonuclease-1-like 5' DNA nuclease
LARRGREFAILAVVVGLAFLAASGYVYATPPVEMPPDERLDEQTFSATVGDRTIVENETPLYQPGQVLENHPAYFTETGSTLVLTSTMTVPTDRAVNITYRFRLRAYAVRGDDVVWTNETLLTAGRARVTDGKLYLEEPIDVVELSDYLYRVEEITQTVAGIRTEVHLDASYETVSTTGEPYKGALNVTRDLRIIDNAYWVEGRATASKTEAVSVPGEPVVGERDTESALWLLGSGFILLALGEGIVRYRRTLPPVAELERAADRAKYAEWISTGEHIFTPTATYLEMDSLADLTNLAIDTNRRVIYDPSERVYVVIAYEGIYYWVEATDDASRSNVDVTAERSVLHLLVAVVWTPMIHRMPKRWRDAVSQRGRNRRRQIRVTEHGSLSGDGNETPSGGDESVTQIRGVGPSHRDRLAAIGIETVDELAAADPSQVSEAVEVPERLVTEWIEDARMAHTSTGTSELQTSASDTEPSGGI